MNSLIHWSEIPEFADEAEEARYWENHQLDGRLMAASVHEADSRESTTITLRFDPRMLSRIKRIARSRFLNYQSMMKQWLAERLEEEMRKQ
jgi:predicted DNA binding CopG/RHH family protein